MKKIAIPICVLLLTLGFGAGAAVWIFPLSFEYELRPVVIMAGDAVHARDFLAETAEMAEVVAYFYGEMHINSYGRYDIPLTLHKNRRVVQTQGVLYILLPVPYVTIELGSSPNITPRDFLSNPGVVRTTPLDAVFISDFPVVSELPVGEHPVELAVNGAAFSSVVQVKDTTPPTAVLLEKTMEMGVGVTVEELVYETFDLSCIVAVEMLNPPDIFVPGVHTVQVRLEDAYGNTAVYETTVTQLHNRVPPVIHGTQHIVVGVGEPVRFRTGVSATDAFDRPISVEIDSSRVNINERGIYQAVYSATDAWGLTTKVAINVHVLNVNPFAVHEMVDEILARILREGMTQVEQARAIHNWIGDNISFAGTARIDATYEAAYQALVHRRGNCFVFYGISSVMLERAGVPNMRIERTANTNNRSHHRWNLINPDNMGWHHFDATPNVILWRNDRFMFTNSQARAHTERLRRENGAIDFYVFDEELYPEIVE